MNLLKLLTKPFGKKEEVKVEPKVEIPAPKPEPVNEVAVRQKAEVHTEVHTELTEEQKLAVVDLIAQGFTPSIVSKKLLEEHGAKISIGNVCNYKRAEKWKPIIKQLRAKYRENIHDIDISHKSTRLRLTEYVAEQAIQRNDLGSALRAVETSRREFEKDGGDTNIFVNNPTYNELNVLSTEELLRRRDEATKKLTQKEIVDAIPGNETEAS